MDNLRIKFNNRRNTEFVSELKSRVNGYFEENKISPYANTAMVIKTIVMYSLYFIPFALILTNLLSTAQVFLMYTIMGFGILGLGCAVQHDANHSAYSKNETINRFLGFSLNLIGGNDYMWKIKHNILHHTYTNIHGKDEDISVVKIMRFSPNAPYSPVHRFQHIFAWLAYSTLTLFWVFYFDFPKLKRYNGFGSPNPEVKHPVNEVIMLFVSKIVYFAVMIVLPLYIVNQPWWVIIGGFVLMHFIAGFLLTTTFQLAHIVEDTEHPVPAEDGSVDAAWFVHQLETTANFATHNKVLTWFIGGLNFQVEHHLFPRICSIHYPMIAEIVRETAQKYDITYNVQPTLGFAISSHYKMLKKFSVKEA